jgi:parallel beta-helix repeat protein
MRFYGLLSVLLLLTLHSAGTIYYFSSSSGNDNYVNNSVTAPWRTMDKVNKIHLLPGDQILFKSGETFYGSLITHGDGMIGNPVIITTYGGDKPAIITGLTTPNQWTDMGGGIWATQDLGNRDVHNVIIDGKQVEMGRYPNDYPTTGGYLVYDSFTNNPDSTSTIYSWMMPYYGIDSSWVGSTLRIKAYLSSLANCRVLSAKDGVLVFDNRGMSYLPFRNGCGFFFTNSIKTLDLYGEWCHKDGKVYIYFGNENPSNHIVEIGTVDTLIQSRNSNYEVNNITFRGANKYGVSNTWAGLSGLKFRKCSFLLSGLDAVAIANRSRFVMDSCLIDGANNNGIILDYNCDSPRITNTVIRNIGTLESNLYCDNGFSRRMGVGVYARGCPTKGLYFENNVIENTGFNGMHISGSGNYIYRNYIAHVCTWLDDGGAIYYAGAPGITYVGTVIRRNILLDAPGYWYGYPSYRVTPNLIFVDDYSSGVMIDSNFVQGSGQSCIYLHNAFNCTVLNNTLSGAKKALFELQNNGHVTMKNIHVHYNQFLTEDTTALFYSLQTRGLPGDSPIDQFGTINNNLLLSPNINSAIIALGNIFVSNTVNWYRFKEWNTLLPYDRNTKVAMITPGRNVSYYTKTDTTIHLPAGKWTTLNGKVIEGNTLHLIDHTGIIVISK